MRTLLLVLALAAAGHKLGIHRKGALQPILAKMDELGQNRLRRIVKDEQKAIPCGELLRIGARPAEENRRVETDSKTTTTDPDVSGRLKTPGASRTGGLSVTSNPDFETVYRKPWSSRM